MSVEWVVGLVIIILCNVVINVKFLRDKAQRFLDATLGKLFGKKGC